MCKLYEWIFNIFPSIIRSILYRCIVDCNTDVKVYGAIKVVNIKNLNIGYGVTINEGVYINATERVEISDNVRISAGAKILTTGLDVQSTHVNKKVIIGPNCWLGANSIILPGVKIAEGTVIAAGAVVNRDVDTPGQLVAGVPARCIKVSRL